MLDAGDSQPGHARTVDRALPAGEFLEAEAIALARLVDAQQAAIDRRHTSALRRTTQRVVDGCGSESMVSGSPSGPIT